MKRNILLLTIIISLMLFACDVGDTDTSDTTSSAESAVSSENSSDGQKESWTETQSTNRLNIKTEYTNYGNDWIKTTENLDVNGDVKKKTIVEVVNEEVVKEFYWEYENGETVCYTVKEYNGTVVTLTRDSIVYDDENIRQIDTESYQSDEDGNEQLVKSETVFKTVSDEKTVAEQWQTHSDNNEEVYYETLFYRNGIPVFYTLRTLYPDSSEGEIRFRRLYSDLDKNPLYEYFSESTFSADGSNDESTVITERFFREDGTCIEAVTKDNSFVSYYDVSDSQLFFVAEFDSETGTQLSGTVYSSYTVEQAQSLLDEMRAVYDAYTELVSEYDYEPIVS